jgi:ribosomal protein S18 acetylase RimI-like enzyme
LEHRPLTDREIVERCCLNLTETYIALAYNATGFRTYEDEGIVGCLSDLQHPAANFVMIARPTPRSIQKLKQLSQERHLMAYLYPTPEVTSIVESLQRLGFEVSNRLNLMFYRGETTKKEIALETVSGFSERYDWALFLAKQFFSHVDEKFSQDIAGLTASARCDLLRSFAGDCGAMVKQTSDTLGLYNIAVSGEKRNRGMGADLVRTLVAEAQERNLHSVLQCNDSLVEWYERLGFRRYDEITMMRSNS